MTREGSDGSARDVFRSLRSRGMPSFGVAPGMSAAHDARVSGARMRLGILGSGKGSNFVAIADAIRAGRVEAEVALVLSDVADAGIQIGRAHV